MSDISDISDMGDALNKIVRDRDESPVTIPRWAVAAVLLRAFADDFSPDWRGEDEAIDAVGDALEVSLPTADGKR